MRSEEKINRDIIDDEQSSDPTKINIYRYKFTIEFMEKLYQFSKIHQYDDRRVFKEEWENWIDDNDDSVSQEVCRLENLGYEGDILDKMFKSARYYFRKKSTAKKEPKKRRIYISCQKDVLDAMDDHIFNGVKMEDYKPSNGFDEFCSKNVDLLKDEVKRLIESDITDTREILGKIKKTYKNRYFIISNKEIN